MNLTDLERHWNELARTDPMWAILTQPDKRGRKWDTADFLRTGANCVEDVMRFTFLRDMPEKREHALDFGCGIGRLTVPMGKYFTYVTGIDISNEMVREARKLHKGDQHCRFLREAGTDLFFFKTGTFDFILSIAVLQHMESQYALAYIKAFMRLLRPGGAAYFQLTHKPLGDARKDAGHVDHELLRRKHNLPDFPRIDMYGVEPVEVEGAVTNNGGRMVEAVRKEGGGWVNYLYLAVKE